MTVAACICVYNETTLLKACLKQFPEWVSKITVLVSELPWFGRQSETAHKTWEILQEWPDKRVEAIKMHWKTEQDQRNWGLGHFSEFDWVLILDADEYFTGEGWDVLYGGMSEWRQTDMIVAPMKTYWKTPEWVWKPADLHMPAVAVRPRKTAFFDKRQTTTNVHRILPIDMHHFSWVRTDEEVLQKIQNYMHAPDFDGKNWYDTVWKAWEPSMKGLHPYGHNSQIQAIREPAPSDILALFPLG